MMGDEPALHPRERPRQARFINWLGYLLSVRMLRSGIQTARRAIRTCFGFFHQSY